MNWLLFAALPACSLHKNHIEIASMPIRTDAALAVTEPYFLVDFDEGDPFRRNTAVGNITFSGGFITENTGEGLFNVSKDIDLSSTEKYREQVRDWLSLGLGPPMITLDSPPPPPKRKERRGTTSHDGHDNVSLPRVDLLPVPASGFERPVLVPWVVTYLSHNGGWFFGQEWGTGGGARIRVMLVAYDTDGSVLGYRDIDGSRISERIFSPTGPQMQDLLIALERRVGRKLD
jgi:hypothetical protein